MRSAVPPRAERIRTGKSESARAARRTARPSRVGSMTSRTIRRGACSRIAATCTAGTRSWEESMSRVVLTLLAFVALLLGPASVAAAADDSAGAVYTLTNTAANAVIVYDRSASGALTWSGTFPTGGRGGSLGSQGAVVTSKDGRWLYAVDAGSNDIAVFKISEDSLVWSDRIASGGTQPVSVTTSHDLVYVVNAASHSIA